MDGRKGGEVVTITAISNTKQLYELENYYFTDIDAQLGRDISLR